MTSSPDHACLSTRPPRRAPRRLAALCHVAGLLGAALFLALPPMGVRAQTLVQQVAEADPPDQVARLNLVEGEVSFSPAEAASAAPAWTRAELNRPLTQGDQLWTGPGARAELHAGSTALRMNAQTSLEFLQLDDSATRLSLPQGTLQLRVRTLFEGQRLEVDTPNLAFVISQPGDYRLDVNPAGDSTRVVALSGAGTLYGDNGQALALAGGQQANFIGTQLTPGAPGAAVQDSFDAWAADRDRQEDQSVAARYVPRDTIGYQQLDSYGDWNQDPAYGAVWLPRALPAAWAPYSAGRWSWIAPWGWTWVDDAPWGFAPFHYGRWARIGPRWGWVPGRLAPRPVYAPALVAFVGGGPGVNWNVNAGGRPQPGVGWFPLAPGEAYRPAYRASPRYITRVNNNITVNLTPGAPAYRYQRLPGAVTAASRDDFMQGRPVRGERHRPDARELAGAQPLPSRAALPPRPDRPFIRPAPGGAGAMPPPTLSARPLVGIRPERTGDGRIDRAGGNPPRPEAIRPPMQPSDNDAVRQQRQAQQMQAVQQRQAEIEQQRQIRAQDPTRARPDTPAGRDQRQAQDPAQQQQRAQMDQQRQVREQEFARQAQARQMQNAQQDQQRLMREQQQAQQTQAQQQQRLQMDQQRQFREQEQARQTQARQIQRDQQDQHRLIREQQQAQQAQAQQQQRAQGEQQRQMREQDQARQAQARQERRQAQQPGERTQQAPRGQPGQGEGRRMRPGPPAQEP